MDYPIKFGDQLRQQLRSLRKARGLNQTELGVLIGVTQRRVAEIEGNPGVVGIDQIVKILSALGSELVVRDLGASPTVPPPDRDRGHHEFRASLVPSAQHLVDALRGDLNHTPEALLWRTTDLGVDSVVSPQDRRRLVDALARALLVNPSSLDRHLADAAKADLPPASPDAPTAEIHAQWAKALSVSREALRHAVKTAFAERQPPLGLSRPTPKGSW